LSLLPHVVNSFSQLATQNWPSLTRKSILPGIKQIWHFHWLELFQVLPGFHLIKRVIDLKKMISTDQNSSEFMLIIQEAEVERLFVVVFQSGPQLILQTAILNRLNYSFTLQEICIGLHFMNVVQSSTSFFFTLRGPKDSPTGPPYGLQRLVIMLLIFLITLARYMSLGLLFSYAKTFITVPIIVIFGISLMALYYDQKGPKQDLDSRTYFLSNLLTIWTPCTVGSKHTYYLLITSLASFAMHLISQLVLLVHVLVLQRVVPNYLPLRLHCFYPTNFSIASNLTHQTEPYYCQVQQEIIVDICTFNYKSCQDNTTDCISYARICPDASSWAHSEYFWTSMITIICLFVAAGLGVLLHFLSDLTTLDAFLHSIKTFKWFKDLRKSRTNNEEETKE
jgi:hypothetical protein